MARDARELLLTAATELFAVQGVAATTFSMIAQRAGLTPAMLHYYFKDRDELLDAVVEERLLRIISRVWDPVLPGASPADTIRGVVQRLLDGIDEMPWVPSTWMREILNEGGLLRERMLCRLPYDKVRLLGSAIAKGQASGSLNPELDPLLTVFSTLGLVMFHMATINFWAETFDRRPLGRRAVQSHIVGLVLDGLCHLQTSQTTTVNRKKKR